MRVLVSAASRHGATAEIAEAIARALRGRGHQAEAHDPERVADLAVYDAFVLGSAVYYGHWLDSAKKLVERNAGVLAQRPVWLFSSGPLGPRTPAPEEPVDVSELIDAIGAGSHQLFDGRLDRAALRFREKAVVAALHAPEGDHRDWAAIDAWAGEIADDLATEPSD